MPEQRNESPAASFHTDSTDLHTCGDSPSAATVEWYEADHHGRVYEMCEDGSVWPTGITIPALAGLNHVSPEVFQRELSEQERMAAAG